MSLDGDSFSYYGAMRLKHTIENYWERRGKFPAVRLEKQYVAASKEERPIYVVRSDLAFDERGYPFINRRGA